MSTNCNYLSISLHIPDLTGLVGLFHRYFAFVGHMQPFKFSFLAVILARILRFKDLKWSVVIFKIQTDLSL